LTPLLAVQTKPLPYFVHRTGTNNLPVYEERKSGGSLRQTRIRKLEGNIEALRQQLIDKFELDPEKVYIGSQTKHIVIKNEHMKSQVEEFLRGLKF
jgi:large subunit ribosomal protein L49